MRELTSLLLVFIFAVVLGVVVLGASGAVSASKSADNPEDEDWTDGPGNFTDWNVLKEFGIHPSVYFQMWSGNVDEKNKTLENRRKQLKTHLRENFSNETMDYMARLNTIARWEYATRLDSGFVKQPTKVAEQWNKNDVDTFAPTAETSKVPQDVETTDGGEFQNTAVIKDAYIIEHSIHPSVTQYTTGPDGETRTERYVMAGAETGDVDWIEVPPVTDVDVPDIKKRRPTTRALVDYRIDAPRGWKVQSHGIEVYRVSDGMCRLGEDGEEWNPDDDEVGGEGSGEDADSGGDAGATNNTRCGIWGRNENVSDQTPSTTFQIKRNGEFPHEWSGSAGRNGNISDEFTFQQKIDFDHEARIEATLVNEESGRTAVVTHDVYHQTTVRVNTFDNIYLQSAELPNGDVQTHVFNPEPWHYVSVAGKVGEDGYTRYGMTTGWEFFTKRDERFDTMTEMSEEGETTVGSAVSPVDVYSYPGSVGPVPWPKDETVGLGSMIHVTQYQPAQKEPPTLGENLEFPEAVTNDYSAGVWALMQYDPDQLPEGADPMKNFYATGMVDGVFKIIQDPDVQRELVGTNLTMEVLDEDYDLQEDESVEVRFTLETADGEPINTDQVPAPLFEELSPSDPAINITHSGRKIYTGPDGTAVADVNVTGLGEGDALRAKFEPPEWYLVEKNATVYQSDTAVATNARDISGLQDRMGYLLWRVFPLLVLSFWLWLFIRMVYASIGEDEEDMAEHVREFFFRW